MIKKVSLVILSNLFIVLFLTGCGKKEENNTSSTTTTNTSTTPPQTKQETPPPPKVSQAEETVKNWINALGNRNFKEAHGLMTSKKGGDYSKFSSTNGYGGINETNILSCKVDTENESSAEVVAEYEAFDPVNRDGKFKQRFIVMKEGDKWLISDIKKIDIAFYNEKKEVEKSQSDESKQEEKTTKKTQKTMSLGGCFADASYKAQYVMDKFGKGTVEYSTSLFGGAIIKGTYKVNGNKVTFNLNDGQSYSVTVDEDEFKYSFYRGSTKYSKYK